MALQCCKLLKGYRIQNITQTLEHFEAAEVHEGSMEVENV